MLRLLHTADVHLGARHADLGEAATAQRERQFAAFRASVDLAIAEKVDLFLIAGDLFDSNVQPRRSVDRVAAELKRLVDARIRSVLIPGTHDVYDRASIYRSYDLQALAGAAGSDFVTLLTPDQPAIRLESLDATVHAQVFATKRAPRSPLAGLDVSADPSTWQIGMVHGSVAIPKQTEHDEVVITTDEIAASKLDYLALGHWHSSSRGKAGDTVYAYSGAPEPVALDQDRAGNVLLVSLDLHDGKRDVQVNERRVGRTGFSKFEVDAATLVSQAALIEDLQMLANPDIVMDVRLIGVRPDALDIHEEEIEAALAESFLKVRVRDRSVPPLSDGPLPPEDTILGAFVRDLEASIAEFEAADNHAAAAEARDILRLGRLLLAGAEVTL
ncbi:MAG: DNA repair exonuclease [Chloroflexota bacterium]|nr:MAG: DNA repair exonuclease [Chloroflexota bacterium]